MILNEEKYSKFALCREMMETGDIIKNFDQEKVKQYIEAGKNKKGYFLTGEGSSRIFPAKRAIYSALKEADAPAIFTDGAAQAMEYNLSDYAVFGASNSGKTGELIRLFQKLGKEKHDCPLALSANIGTPLEDLADKTYILSCGKEDAVAATKSVIEQGLFYDAFFSGLKGKTLNGLEEAGKKLEETLSLNIDSGITEKIANAGTIYFAGRNNGIAEELTLKTNEITRKKSDFLEGTYGVHGIEEVMNPDDVLIIIDPFKEEAAKFKKYLGEGVGMEIIAVSAEKTIFPTITIPDGKYYKDYMALAAGWNILVETGIFLNIDLDKPERARKIGNEFTPGS